LRPELRLMELPMKATPAELHLKQRVQQPEFEQVEFERFVFRVQSCEYSFFSCGTTVIFAPRDE
jgi:hypothetical protein